MFHKDVPPNCLDFFATLYHSLIELLNASCHIKPRSPLYERWLFRVSLLSSIGTFFQNDHVENWKHAHIVEQKVCTSIVYIFNFIGQSERHIKATSLIPYRSSVPNRFWNSIFLYIFPREAIFYTAENIIYRSRQWMRSEVMHSLMFISLLW